MAAGLGRDLDKADLERRWADLGPAGIADALELGGEERGDSVMFCCPWHEDETPSASLQIGEKGTPRVHCFACSESWDIHSLVAVLHGVDVSSEFPELLRREDEILCAYTEQDRAPGLGSRVSGHAPERREYPPAEEVERLWSDCECVTEHSVSDSDALIEVVEFLLDRNADPRLIAKADVVRRLPAERSGWVMAWFPGLVDARWAIVLPAYDHQGRMRSLHGRSVVAGDEGAKGVWPKGHTSSGLALANERAIQLLKGKPSVLDVLFVEGAPDFLRACAREEKKALKGAAVFGIGASSKSFLSAACWPADLQATIATHSDRAGCAYASRVLEALPESADARVIDLRTVSGGGEGKDLDQLSEEALDRALALRFSAVRELRDEQPALLVGGMQASVSVAATLRSVDVSEEGPGAWLDSVVDQLDAATEGSARLTMAHLAARELIQAGARDREVSALIGAAGGPAHDVALAVRQVRDWMGSPRN